ncbi:MAG: twin-arginine translocase subunit TatC [Verrucomicrobia bacterium]|nr:twin-arginine translocase subunit TatC [Verrucomicrobiota bacterium]
MEDDEKIVPVEEEDLAVIEEAEEGGHMTFLEHLDELRIVLFKCAAAFLFAFVLVAVFFRQITELLRMPVDKAMENHGVTEALVTTSPFGVFSFLLQLGLMGGVAIASPFILYFASSFIAPGLSDKERRTLLPGAIVALFLFSVGCVFSYIVLVPSALNVSIYLNNLLGFSLVWAADRYMSLLLWMVLGIGLSFEFPLIITILVYVGILTQKQLKDFRRYAIVLIFVLGAFITPTTDPVTQTLMAGPMWLLYEAAILVAGIIERRKKREYEAEFGAWDDDDENYDD